MQKKQKQPAGVSPSQLHNAQTCCAYDWDGVYDRARPITISDGYECN